MIGFTMFLLSLGLFTPIITAWGWTVPPTPCDMSLHMFPQQGLTGELPSFTANPTTYKGSDLGSDAFVAIIPTASHDCSIFDLAGATIACVTSLVKGRA